MFCDIMYCESTMLSALCSHDNQLLHTNYQMSSCLMVHISALFLTIIFVTNECFRGRKPHFQVPYLHSQVEYNQVLKICKVTLRKLHWESCFGKVGLRKLYWKSCIGNVALHWEKCTCKVALEKFHISPIFNHHFCNKSHLQSCIGKVALEKLHFQSCSGNIALEIGR